MLYVQACIQTTPTTLILGGNRVEPKDIQIHPYEQLPVRRPIAEFFKCHKAVGSFVGFENVEELVRTIIWEGVEYDVPAVKGSFTLANVLVPSENLVGIVTLNTDGYVVITHTNISHVLNLYHRRGTLSNLKLALTRRGCFTYFSLPEPFLIATNMSPHILGRIDEHSSEGTVSWWAIAASSSNGKFISLKARQLIDIKYVWNMRKSDAMTIRESNANAILHTDGRLTVRDIVIAQ